MIDSKLDESRAVLHVQPTAALTQTDFEQLADKVDPFIESHGGLQGLILEVTEFPGWENLGGMSAHFRFIRDHHKQVKKVAIVTDSKIGDLAENLASHFLSAEIKHFAANELESANAWIAGES